MAKIKVIQLTDQQRLQLDEGFRQGKSHAYRMRYRAILLKSAGLTSKQVGLHTEMTNISVNSWVKRFEADGIKGLETRLGRGRKPIMDSSDEETVRKAIENDRQSLKKAKEYIIDLPATMFYCSNEDGELVPLLQDEEWQHIAAIWSSLLCVPRDEWAGRCVAILHSDLMRKIMILHVILQNVCKRHAACLTLH